MDEYIFLINNLGLSNSYILEWLRVAYSKELTDNLGKVIKKGCNDKKIKVYREISRVWDNNDNVNMKLENKFNYGKHGSNEFIKLFNNIGINDIFETIKIESLEETIFDENTNHDFKATINNLTNQRNSIIHQDRSTNITHTELEKHR